MLKSIDARVMCDGISSVRSHLDLTMRPSLEKKERNEKTVVRKKKNELFVCSVVVCT